MAKSLGFPKIFCHSKRPDWGSASCQAREKAKRSYLFEDGEERTLGTAGVLWMLKVEHPDPDQQQTCGHLLAEANS